MSIISIFGTRWIMKLDYKNPATIQLGRICVAAYLVVAQLLKLVLKYIIKKDGNKEIVKPKAGLFGMEIPGMANNPIMQMMSSFGAGANKNDVPLTVEQYDLHAIRELFSSLVINLVVVCVCHLLLKKHSFLFIVPFMGLQSWVKAPIILIRLFGLKPVGQLARPFKNQMEIMLEGLMPPVEAEATSAPAADEPPVVTAPKDALVIEENDKSEDSNEEEVEEGPEEEEGDEEDEEDEEGSDNGSNGNTLSATLASKELDVKVHLVAESVGVRAGKVEDVGEAITGIVSEAAEQMEELIHKLEAEEALSVDQQTDSETQDEADEESSSDEEESADE